ncbi:hypothetical protein PAMP_021116 [Pampus punctatissimus]
MKQHFAGARNMPMNNNQKVQSAAARLAKLPMLRSACAKLSVLYTDTKCSHPNLRSVCEVLENSVTALGAAASDRISPVFVKLEPQISIANDVACKSLDWLETTFPVIHAPTEQIVVGAKNKMLEIRNVVNIAANGTLDCIQHSVAWVIERMQQADEQANHAVVERAIIVASVGLDSALNMSEALMDRVLPPTKEEKEEEAAHLVEGFEAATLSRSYPVRLVTLTAKLCRRTYHKAGAKVQSVEVCCWYSFTRGLGDFIQIFKSSSGPSDQLAGLGLEPPRTPPVSPASGVLLYLPDVQLRLRFITTEPLQSR